jgi:hypothetical protein
MQYRKQRLLTFTVLRNKYNQSEIWQKAFSVKLCGNYSNQQGLTGCSTAFMLKRNAFIK